MYKKEGTKSCKWRFATGKENGAGHISNWEWRKGDVSYEDALEKWNRFTRKKFAKDNYETCKNANG